MPNIFTELFNEIDQYIDANSNNDQKLKEVCSNLTKLTSSLAKQIQDKKLSGFGGCREKLEEISKSFENYEDSSSKRKSVFEKILDPAIKLKITFRELVYIYQIVFQHRAWLSIVGPKVNNIEYLTSMIEVCTHSIKQFIHTVQPIISINLQNNFNLYDCIEDLKQPEDVFSLTQYSFEVPVEYVNAAQDLAIKTAFYRYVLNVNSDKDILALPIVVTLKDYLIITEFSVVTKINLPNNQAVDELLESLSLEGSKLVKDLKIEQQNGAQLNFNEINLEKKKIELLKKIFTHYSYTSNIELNKASLVWLQAVLFPIIKARLKDQQEELCQALEAFHCKACEKFLENDSLLIINDSKTIKTVVANRIKELVKASNKSVWFNFFGNTAVDDIVIIAQFFLGLQPPTDQSLGILVDLYANAYKADPTGKELHWVIYYYRHQLSLADAVAFISYSLKQQKEKSWFDDNNFKTRMSKFFKQLIDSNRSITSFTATFKMLIKEYQEFFGLKFDFTEAPYEQLINLNVVKDRGLEILTAIASKQFKEVNAHIINFNNTVIKNKHKIADGIIDFPKNQQSIKMTGLEIVDYITAESYQYLKEQTKGLEISLDYVKASCIKVIYAISRADLESAGRLFNTLVSLIEDRKIEEGTDNFPIQVNYQGIKTQQSNIIPSHVTEKEEAFTGRQMIEFVAKKLVDHDVKCSAHNYLAAINTINLHQPNTYTSELNNLVKKEERITSSYKSMLFTENKKINPEQITLQQVQTLGIQFLNVYINNLDTELYYKRFNKVVMKNIRKIEPGKIIFPNLIDLVDHKFIQYQEITISEMVKLILALYANPYIAANLATIKVIALELLDILFKDKVIEALNLLPKLLDLLKSFPEDALNIVVISFPCAGDTTRLMTVSEISGYVIEQINKYDLKLSDSSKYIDNDDHMPDEHVLKFEL